jgi:hypothetical protein
MNYRLPGYTHLAHGLDVFTGEETEYPLFDFNFCGSEDHQDVYRGLNYKIPIELDVVPYPKCKFSSSSSFYSSETEMNRAMDKSQEFSASLEASGGIWGVSIDASASLSLSSTSKSASQQRQKNSGQLAVTDTICYTTKVVNVDDPGNIHFSSQFIKRIADIESNRGTKTYVDLIKDFGSHYYKSASLGGRLRQISSIEKKKFFSLASSEVSSSLSTSLKAGASGYGYSARGSVDYSSSQSGSSSDQQEFEDNTSKTDIIASGGAPGSFGPPGSSDDSAPNTYSSWAATVDLLPIPVDFKVAVIGDLLPNSIKKRWYDGLKDFISGKSQDLLHSTTYRVTVQMKSPSNVSPSLLNANFGPFAFQMIGTNTTKMINWRPFGPESDSDAGSTFKIGEGVSFTFTDKSIGPIKSVQFQDLRVIEDGYASGDAPWGWPVKTIQIVDETDGFEFNFGLNDSPLDFDSWSYNFTSGIFSSSKSLPSTICSSNRQCSVSTKNITNYLKLSLKWENPKGFGAIPFVKVTATGTSGQIIDILSNTNCQGSICGEEANGQSVHWIQGQVGQLLSLEFVASTPYPLDPLYFQRGNPFACSGRPFPGYGSSSCTSKLWNYPSTTAMTNSVYLGFDSINATSGGIIGSKSASLFVAIDPSKPPTPVFSGGGAQDNPVGGDGINITLVLYSPLNFNYTIPIVQRSLPLPNRVPPNIYNINVGIVPGYQGAVCQDVSVSLYYGGNRTLFATLSATNKSSCVLPASYITETVATVFDNQNNSQIYRSSKVVTVTYESQLPTLAKACVPFQSDSTRNSPELTKLVCGSVVSTYDCSASSKWIGNNAISYFYSTWSNSTASNIGSTAPDGSLVSDSCKDTPSFVQKIHPQPI